MEADGDPERIAHLTWEVAFQLIWQNRLAEGMELLERTLDQIDDAPCSGNR